MTPVVRPGSQHAYVDESKRGPYLMCAFVTEPASRKRVVAELNRIRPPRASRLHMKNESEPTKRAILSALCELGVTSTVYVSRIKPFHAARAAIIQRGIWPQVLTEGIERLILEPEVGQDERDRRQLYRLAAATGDDRSGVVRAPAAHLGADAVGARRDCLGLRERRGVAAAVATGRRRCGRRRPAR